MCESVVFKASWPSNFCFQENPTQVNVKLFFCVPLVVLPGCPLRCTATWFCTSLAESRTALTGNSAASTLTPKSSIASITPTRKAFPTTLTTCWCPPWTCSTEEAGKRSARRTPAASPATVCRASKQLQGLPLRSTRSHRRRRSRIPSRVQRGEGLQVQEYKETPLAEDHPTIPCRAQRIGPRPEEFTRPAWNGPKLEHRNFSGQTLLDQHPNSRLWVSMTTRPSSTVPKFQIPNLQWRINTLPKCAVPQVPFLTSLQTSSPHPPKTRTRTSSRGLLLTVQPSAVLTSRKTNPRACRVLLHRGPCQWTEWVRMFGSTVGTRNAWPWATANWTWSISTTRWSQSRSTAALNWRITTDFISAKDVSPRTFALLSNLFSLCECTKNAVECAFLCLFVSQQTIKRWALILYRQPANLDSQKDGAGPNNTNIYSNTSHFLTLYTPIEDLFLWPFSDLKLIYHCCK